MCIIFDAQLRRWNTSGRSGESPRLLLYLMTLQLAPAQSLAQENVNVPTAKLSTANHTRQRGEKML
jgi:hypothetical protein